MNLRSLQENVVETIEAFDNVAQVIEEKTGAEEGSIRETIRPIHYGDILRRLEFSGGDISVAQLTVYKERKSGDPIPSTPVGGDVDLITGALNPPTGWSFIPYGNEEVWASTSIWNSGVNQTGWSVPYLTSGVSGVAGEDGKDGIGLVSIEQTTESTGEGEVNVITATMSDGQVSTFRIRNGSAGETGPVGPAGPAGPQGPSGKDGVDGKDGADGMDGVDGKDGADGMDGSVYEYIYFRGFTANDKPFTPMGGNNIDDYVPVDTKTVTINGNQVVLVWSDKAQGVDEIYKFEWQSERKKENATTWGNFSDPILWAKYGEKGKDGDGVQYIFTRTTTQTAPENPTPSDWETSSTYQNNEADEYIPDGWTDDPEDVDETNKYCWVSVRKYRNSKWGQYSKPTLWTKWVESSGTVTADVVMIDMDPDWVMLNEDENTVSTVITAFRGDDPVIIKDVTADNGDCTFNAESNDGGKTWNVTVSDITAKSSTTAIKINVKLSETSTRTKTFTIYHTQFDKETVSVDFGDDNVLVPCADGQNPDEGFFTNFEIPVLMRVGGELVTVTSITPDNYTNCFSMTAEGNLKVNSFPGTGQQASVKFTVSDGINSGVGYVNFTKFNTQGGTLAMYTLNIDANDIVCDTRKNTNDYKVYAGKKGKSDNIIKASVNKYSSKEGNSIISVSDLPGNYAVFYANDPEDWKEDATSTIGEYQKITNAGIEIGKTINPDKCVSFQLREWIGEGEAWSNMIESNYKVWDTENILVDIIRDIASYQFVITPNKIHVDVEGNVVLPKDKKITIGLTKNVAGDGVAEYIPLTKCPAGYDLYYEIDNNGDAVKFGGEKEDDNLPYTLELDNIKNSVVLTMVVDENSDDSGMVVLSETIEITSDIPGKSAYVGYLTDSMCTVSCDANGNPTAGQVYETTFKVTNGTVQNVTLPQGNGYKLTHEGNGKIKIDSFTQALSEVTKLKFTATYVDSEGITGEEEAGYTIVKLKIAEASTILDFSNDNVIIPCDENGQPYISEASTFVAMLHGDDVLNLTSTDVTLGDRDKQGYYKISFNVNNLVFNGEDVCNKELTFTGKDATGESWTRKGQLIFTKMKAGESGQIWDLVLTTNSPKYNNDTDSFDDDYVEGWVNIWGAEDWEIASYNTLSSASRYIVAKPNEDNKPYVPLTANDFVNDRFRIYINTLENNEGKTFIDVDTPSGIKIALAKLENGVYVPIQEEIMRASYDGRDFGKFELALSDTTIHQTYKDGEQVTVTPNEISIVGVYEYEGVVRHDYKGGKIHNKYVSGLDIYYCIDSEEIYTEYNSSMTEVPDKDNDGWYTNDTILTSVGTVKNRLDVYLVAEYDDPDVEGNATVKKVVDHKALLVVPIDLPNSSYHMELDQDELKVPIDEKGTVDPEFTASVTPYLYMDDDLQSITFEYAFGSDEQPKSGWADNKSFSASDFAGNHTYIWFRPKDKEVYKKCKITKELNPVEIFIDKQIVKRELSTGLVNDSITLEIKHWNYVNNTWDSVAGSVIMKYKTTTSNSESSYNISPSDGKYIVNLNNNTFADINYIRFEVTANGKVSFEEVGVITDGRDGSSKEVLYYKSKGEKPDNPTPLNWTETAYQSKELPSEWYSTEYTNCDNVKISTETAAKWVDEYPGVDATNITVVYACERKKDSLTGVWNKFSEPRVYARYAKDGTDGAPSWSWRLSDPIEMVSFKSDGTANGTINSTTKALASCGGNEVTNVSLSIKNADGCSVSCNGDTLTLKGVPGGTDTNNFTVVLEATGTYGNYTDTAELKYTVKKWFGEPSTVQVHLNNADTPVPTDSNGNYPEDVVRTATLTASSGTSVVNITSVQSQVSGVTATLNDSSLKVTVPTTVTGWSNDVLTVPIVCTLADGYPAQTVSMSFYKVRAAKDAEYPDVYDLLVTPSSLLVSVDQETGKAKYPVMSIIPCILQYSASGAEKGLTVQQFNQLGVGTVSYNFDGETDSDGSVKFIPLTQNSIYVSNNKNTWDADEYIDIRLSVGNRVQTERVTISHDPIPNIDWELELTCSERILYKSDRTTQITNISNVGCKLYKVLNGVKTYATQNDDYFGFDIQLWLDGIQQASYIPGTLIGIDKFTSSCKFVLVNPDEGNIVWDTKEVTKEYAEKGDAGEASIVTQLTNPSGTIMVVNGAFQSTTSESNLRALKGTEFGNITGVKITEITVNGTPVANDYVSVEHTDDITDPYTEEKLLFTINSSKVDKTKEQTIEVTIQFTAFGKTFTEVKTILVRLAAENSCYLMLTDSNVSVAKDKALLSWNNQGDLTNTSLNAVLFDGKTSAQGAEYSATFDSVKVKGSCNSSTGLISITAANPDYDTIEIPVTAKYRGGTYTTTLRVSIDVTEWKLKTNLLMINPDHPTDIVCSCLMNGEPIFGNLNISAGWYRYKIDNGTWTSGQNITKNTFTISKDIAKTVTNQMTIEWHSLAVNSGENLLDSQTIGVLKDGVSGESAVHLELTQDSYNISLSKDSHENISKAVLYNGSTALTSGVTYTSSRASATSEKVTIDGSGNITLDKSTITSTDSTPVNVTITATYDQKPYTKTFTLTKNAWDIWLSIDNVAINADDPKAITGRVMQNSSVFTKSNYYKLYYTLNGTGGEQSITSTDGAFTISLDTVKKATSSLEIYLIDSKGNLYDKESIGVVKNGTDGVNAQYYQIDANHILITKDSKGNVISPSEAIIPKVCYINGAAKEDQDYNSLINEGYYIWKKLNGGTATKISNSTSLSTACSLVNTQLVYYLCKKTVISNPETQFEDYVEIDVIQTEPGEKGEDGSAGSNGPVIYPAGEWTSGTYTGNIQKAPYVSVTDGTNISYYIAYGSLSAKPSSTNTLASNVALDWTKPANKWVKMENYNAIYADIGVLKQALVGKWVFHGNYMFSQDGTKVSIKSPTSGSTGDWDNECAYDTFTDPATAITNGQFKPNVCIDAKSGTLVTRSSEFNSDGTGYVGSYIDNGKFYKGLQWDENSIKLGNNLKITNDGFIASDNLSNPTSYFKLGSYSGYNGEYLEFKDGGNGGFRSSSCTGFGLAVYGKGTFTNQHCHQGALTVITGSSTYGIQTDGAITATGITDAIASMSVADAQSDLNMYRQKYKIVQVYNPTSTNSSINWCSDIDHIAPYSAMLFQWDGSKWTLKF